MTMFDLTDKTALVTGASGGIGAGIAKALAAAGAKVALHGTRQSVLEELAKSIPNSVIVIGNLGEPGAPEKVVADAEAALGGTIDILIQQCRHHAG